MKIAISGAGIAGPTLAHWLLHYGHEPTLIEKAPSLRTGGYIIDFWGTGYSVAERMGILPAILEAGYSVKEVRFVGEDGRKAASFSTDVFHEITQGRFTSLPRSELSAIIYGTLMGRVETLFGDEITGLEQFGSHVRLEFKHAAPRDFDLLVGADGLHSNVRRLAFGPERQFDKPLGYHVAAFEVDGYQPRDELVYVCHTSPGRQIARFTLRHDRTLFLLVFVDELLGGRRPQCTPEVKEAIHHVFRDARWEAPAILATLNDVNEVYFDTVSQIRMNEWSRGRVALLGDAAACVSLLAGEGCGLGMTEAYVLAGELHSARGEYTEAFRKYERLLRPLIDRKQKAARKFGGAFAPRTRFGVWFRNLVANLLGFRPVAEYFIAQDLRDGLVLPHYCH